MLSDAMKAVDTFENMQAAQARLRAVAFNAILEMMLLQNRQVVTDDDAARGEAIFQILVRSGGNGSKAPTISTPTPVAEDTAKLTTHLDAV